MSGPANSIHEPDPARVEAWRSMMSEAILEVQALVHARSNYDRFAALVRSNPHVLHGESDFPVHVQKWFIHFATMAIRRIVEPNSSGDIVSLRGVLDEMVRAARAFTSASISELFESPTSPNYDEELKQFLISRMWRNVANPSSEQEQLNAKMLKDDRRMLQTVSQEITDLVDKVIAHHTRDASKYSLLYAEVSTCVDIIEAIALRYQTTLLGPSMATLVPVEQFNWLDIFSRNWLYDATD